MAVAADVRRRKASAVGVRFVSSAAGQDRFDGRMSLSSEYRQQCRWRAWPTILDALPPVRGQVVCLLGHVSQRAALRHQLQHDRRARLTKQ